MRFAPNGSTRLKILYLRLRLLSIPSQKEFLKYVNSKESKGSLKSFESIKAEFAMNENDKKVPFDQS